MPRWEQAILVSLHGHARVTDAQPARPAGAPTGIQQDQFISVGFWFEKISVFLCRAASSTELAVPRLHAPPSLQLMLRLNLNTFGSQALALGMSFS